jgi:membrane protease YdiL (CAAX protease family)
MIIKELLRAIFQITAMSIIPVVFWLVGKRKKESFFSWIGLKKWKITEWKKFAASLVIALLVAVSMSLVLDPILSEDIQLANERFHGLGFEALIPAILFSFFATGLSEEILFRGFLGKHLSNKFGFHIGNTIQALIFGLLHGATMFSELGIVIPLLVISFTGTLGWLMGYLNKSASGSILPSWFLHGMTNLFAAIMIMFELK